jgi:hypothetical protein
MSVIDAHKVPIDGSDNGEFCRARSFFKNFRAQALAFFDFKNDIQNFQIFFVGNRGFGKKFLRLELAQTGYRVGYTDLRAVQQQMISLQSARQALLRVESERLSQRTILHLALGGSFEPVPVVAGQAVAEAAAGQ